MIKAAFGVWVLTEVVLVATVAATYSMLPDPVATHFGANGQADDWRPRSDYAAYLITASAMVSAMCAGPLYLARKLPDSMINVPNRDYWLALERRGEAYDRLFALGLAIGAATTGLFVAIHLLTVRANRARPPRVATGEAVVLIAAFLAVLAGVVLGFSGRAWKVDATDSERRRRDRRE